MPTVKPLFSIFVDMFLETSECQEKNEELNSFHAYTWTKFIHNLFGR